MTTLASILECVSCFLHTMHACRLAFFLCFSPPARDNIQDHRAFFLTHAPQSQPPDTEQVIPISSSFVPMFSQTRCDAAVAFAANTRDCICGCSHREIPGVTW